MKTVFWIALGGSIGSLLRYWISGVLQSRSNSLFPVGTLGVNLLGCFLIGVLMAIVMGPHNLRPEWRLFMGIGVLGAFTTFSTFGYETLALIDSGSWLPALANVLISVIGGLAMVVCGRWLALWIAGA